jgi:hypothetical protein
LPMTFQNQVFSMVPFFSVQVNSLYPPSLFSRCDYCP